ncbi:MAG TPA: hypothetical protein VK729_11555 [Silvibacterium sp.]|jgi:hypothetical protein|nr:hypothetical protein [Silvibacterium sp.]
MTEITPRAGEQLSRTYLAIAGAAAFLHLRTFLLPATPVIAHDDQSIFFARAVKILHGQILYRDFFEFVPPGTDLLYAAGFASSVFMPGFFNPGASPSAWRFSVSSPNPPAEFFMARSSCFQGFSFSSSISLPQWSRPTTGIAPSPHLPRSAHFPAD